VAVGQAACVGRPGVCAVASICGCSHTIHSARGRGYDDAPSGATTTAAIIVGCHANPAVGGDDARSAQRAGSDHHDPTAGTARGGEPARVVATPGAAAASEHDAPCRGGERGAPQAADRLIGVPAVAAHAALPSVGATATTRVLVVGRRVEVGAATA